MTEAIHGRPTSLRILTTGFLAVWLVMALFPFAWTVWGSFKVEPDFFSRVSFWNAIEGKRTIMQTGSAFTLGGYEGAWIKNEFWRSAINTIIVTLSVTFISLFVGTLGGYALARSGHRYAFWVLIAALVFRAMPHITLVSGYLLPFFQLNIWGVLPPQSLCSLPSTSLSPCGCCTPSSCRSPRIWMRARWWMDVPAFRLFAWSSFR